MIDSHDASNPGVATARQFSRSGRWTRLCLKELRETLRDRRTLITLILMPLLVYPILSMVFQRSLMTAFTGQRQRIVIGVTNQSTAELIRANLMLGDTYLEDDRGDTLADVLLRAKARHQGSMPNAPPSQTPESPTSSDGSTAIPAADPDSNVDPDPEAGEEDSTATGNPASDAATENGKPPVSAAPPALPSLPGLPQAVSLTVEQIEFVKAEDLDQQVRSEKIDLGILTPDETDTGQFELIHRQGSTLSQRALRFVEQRLDAVNELILRKRLQDSGRVPALAFNKTRRSIVVPTRDTTLSTIVPMILILMTVTGAVYPAIDLTAGERERGTLEMLMASPVPRLKLLLAKYVAVVSVAFLTALVNLTAMTITLQSTGLSRVLFGESGLGLVRVLQILALLVLFAAFFSAVLLALTSFARSFKEAQAYLIPLMLLSLGPGVVSLLPGLELRGLLAITPVSNMVLLARDLCSGGVDSTMATVAVMSTGLYTLAAIGVAARIFGTDAVMSGGQSELRTLFSADADREGVSSVSGALLCLATLFPIYFVTSSALGQLGQLSIPVRLALSGMATSLLFGAVPYIAARLQGLKMRRAFGIRGTLAAAFTVALMLGVTVWPIAHEIILFTQALGLATIRPEQMAAAEGLLAELRTVSPILILLSMAVAPAVFEELFFRGYLFHALRAATSRRNTILVSAVLFGFFHVISNSALSVERFLPSTFMGLVLGWLCYQSGSVLPGILLHTCHNGTLMMFSYYKDELSALGIGVQEQAHMPTPWIAASVVTLLIGAGLIAMFPQTRPD